MSDSSSTRRSKMRRISKLNPRGKGEIVAWSSNILQTKESPLLAARLDCDINAVLFQYARRLRAHSRPFSSSVQLTGRRVNCSRVLKNSPYLTHARRHVNPISYSALAI